MSITVGIDAEKKMINHLLSLQSEGRFCDLEIKTGGESVHAHKCILSSTLDFFRTSFNFSEKTRAEMSIDLSHLHCNAATVRKVIRSLYSNEISITQSDIEGILQLADYFMHSDLLLAIEKYMKSTLDISKAALYFQLCLQYGFDKSKLFSKTCLLLSSRMHDYLIHQLSSLDWTVDVTEAMMRYNLFDLCTPLQMTKFMLKKIKTLLSESPLYGKEELSETSLAILNVLDLFLAHKDKSSLLPWSSSIVDYFNTWMESVNDQISGMDDVVVRLVAIRDSTKDTATVPHCLANKNKQKGESSSSVMQETQVVSNFRETFTGLVVLSPSYDMVSQLMEVEDRTPKPLLRSPQLCLHLYDPDLHVWRFGGNLDFPLQGYMMEKHAWRVAFVNKSLFLFSLTKKKGLEYNIENKEWSELSCDVIFQPHNILDDSNGGPDDVRRSSVVRSIIPISVEDSLVVLSMSREQQNDRTYFTQQHIYQFDFESKTFRHITYVRDTRMALPMTKWTVDGDNLVTVKASTIMFGDLQVFHVQHIHVYNAKSQSLETHHVDCAMKSGLKVFLRQMKLYLLNNFNEYKIYCLVNRDLSDWFPLPNTSFPVTSGDPDVEVSYPAMLRLSCNAGSSRWVLNSNFNVESASLSELYISPEGEFVHKCHPYPPFLYMTTMCSSKLNKAQMASLDQAVFCVRNKKN